MGKGKAAGSREESSGEELGGEEPRYCDGARKGTVVGKGADGREARACVQGYLGRKEPWGRTGH